MGGITGVRAPSKPIFTLNISKIFSRDNHHGHISYSASRDTIISVDLIYRKNEFLDHVSGAQSQSQINCKNKKGVCDAKDNFCKSICPFLINSPNC